MAANSSRWPAVWMPAGGSGSPSPPARSAPACSSRPGGFSLELDTAEPASAWAGPRVPAGHGRCSHPRALTAGRHAATRKPAPAPALARIQTPHPAPCPPALAVVAHMRCSPGLARSCFWCFASVQSAGALLFAAHSGEFLRGAKPLRIVKEPGGGQVLALPLELIQHQPGTGPVPLPQSVGAATGLLVFIAFLIEGIWRLARHISVI